MSERDSIEKMLREIRLYRGNFGDPAIDCVDFDPIDLLRLGDRELALGAGIALLVEFCSHIDNATYKDALLGMAAANIRSALAESLCQEYPRLQSALNAALRSESDLNLALREIYVEYLENA
jgi:hypothetical protein